MPLLLKFSSDSAFEDLEQSVAIAESHAIDGYILCNTTTSRAGLKTDPARIAEIGNGGLSGPLLTDKTAERVSFVHRQIKGAKPIIGVGGVNSADSAYRLIKAGAALVELYTALIYHGPGLAKTIL